MPEVLLQALTGRAQGPPFADPDHALITRCSAVRSMEGGLPGNPPSKDSLRSNVRIDEDEIDGIFSDPTASHTLMDQGCGRCSSARLADGLCSPPSCVLPYQGFGSHLYAAHKAHPALPGS